VKKNKTGIRVRFSFGFGFGSNEQLFTYKGSNLSTNCYFVCGRQSNDRNDTVHPIVLQLA
jgi:hypothetical protein